MAYHADVAFLEECSPALIEMNAAEFARIRDLLVSTEPSVNKARNQTVWESPHRAQYDARLSDTRTLVTGLADGFGKARTALLRCADAVGLAQRHLDDGLHAENVLDQLVARVATAVTPTAKLAEPMRRWEDIRENHRSPRRPGRTGHGRRSQSARDATYGREVMGLWNEAGEAMR